MSVLKPPRVVRVADVPTGGVVPVSLDAPHPLAIVARALYDLVTGPNDLPGRPGFRPFHVIQSEPDLPEVLDGPPAAPARRRHGDTVGGIRRSRRG